MFTVRFDDALRFASRLHCSQVRKGSDVPYICHPLAVAALVIEDGGSEDEAIAALLHDAIEDHGDRFQLGRTGLRREIRERYGQAVLDIVNACTDDEGFDKNGPGAKAAWRTRKEAYLKHLAYVDSAVRRVSCADKVHNSRSIVRDFRQIGDSLWMRFRTGDRGEVLWYYDALAKAFVQLGGGPLAEELDRTVDELFRLAGAVRA